MRLERQRGSTSNKVRIFIPDNTSTTGGGLTGLTNSSTNLVIAYARENDSGFTTYTGANIETITTIGTFANPSSSSKVRFKAVDATNAPGLYELHFHDSSTAFGSGDTSEHVVINLLETSTTALKIGPCLTMIPLVPWNPQDGVRQGMTALPNAAAAAAGGLHTIGTGAGQIQVDGAGNAFVDVKKINAVATTSVMVVSANVGTTQPVNFTGTAGSALVKSDAIDFASQAVTLDANNLPKVSVSAWGGTLLVSPFYTPPFAPPLRILSDTFSAKTDGIFDDSDGRMLETGTVWQQGGGYFAFNGRLVDNTGGGNAFNVTDSYLSDSYELRVVINGAGSTTGDMGLIFRGDGANVNSCWYAAIDFTAGLFKLGTFTSGGAFALVDSYTLSPTNFTTFDPAVDHVVSVRVNGTSIMATMDGVVNDQGHGLCVATAVSSTFQGQTYVGTAANWINIGGIPGMSFADFHLDTPMPAQTFGKITGAASGPGVIKITSTAHGLSTSDVVSIYNVKGTTEANADRWTITKTDNNSFTLNGSTFTHAYTSGGFWLKVPSTVPLPWRVGYAPTATPADYVVHRVLTNNIASYQAIAGTLGNLLFAQPSGWSLTPADIAAAVNTDTTNVTTPGSPGYVTVHQLGGAFTTSNSSVFTVAALANAPAGGGGGGDPWATAQPGSYALTTFGGLVASKLALITSFTIANNTAPSGPVISSSIAYATAADLTTRFDVRVVCQLLSDSGVPVAASTLSTNPTLTTLLQTASGLVEAACLARQLYSVADLNALAGTNSGALLVDIVCGLAFARLPRRRSWEPATMLETQAQALLEALSNGEAIFGLATHAAAGVASHAVEKAADVVVRDDIVVQAERMFGQRANRLNG